MEGRSDVFVKCNALCLCLCLPSPSAKEQAGLWANRSCLPYRPSPRHASSHVPVALHKVRRNRVANASRLLGRLAPGPYGPRLLLLQFLGTNAHLSKWRCTSEFVWYFGNAWLWTRDGYSRARGRAFYNVMRPAPSRTFGLGCGLGGWRSLLATVQYFFCFFSQVRFKLFGGLGSLVRKSWT
jgi:hypothetical protein